MIRLVEIVLGMAFFAGLIWLFVKVLEVSKPSPVMEHLKHRNRIQTLFADKEEDP